MVVMNLYLWFKYDINLRWLFHNEIIIIPERIVSYAECQYNFQGGRTPPCGLIEETPILIFILGIEIFSPFISVCIFKKVFYHESSFSNQWVKEKFNYYFAFFLFTWSKWSVNEILALKYYVVVLSSYEGENSYHIIIDAFLDVGL